MNYSKKTLLYLSAFIISAFALTSCGTTPPKKTDLGTVPIQDMKDAPKWVIKCAGAFSGDKGKVIYGCSSAVLTNAPLKRQAANNRARNEIAKFIKVYTASLMKDYRSEIVAGDPNASEWEMYVQEVQKTVSSSTLVGVEIVDHWENPSTGEFFSLARMDLNQFEENINNTKKIKSSVKKIIQQNSERLHDQLEKEELNIENKN